MQLSALAPAVRTQLVRDLANVINKHTFMQVREALSWATLAGCIGCRQAAAAIS